MRTFLVVSGVALCSAVTAEPPPRRVAKDAPGATLAAPSRSPCGRHTFEVADGYVSIDGAPVHKQDGPTQLVGRPTWRPDGGALAWIERKRGETRLFVLPKVRRFSAELLDWALPSTVAKSAIHWVGASRLVVGREALQPLAIASWTEETNER